MKTGKLIAAIGWLFLVFPIWLYLLYKVLQAVNATELMWFLYWVYVAAGIVLGIISRLADSNE